MVDIPKSSLNLPPRGKATPDLGQELLIQPRRWSGTLWETHADQGRGTAPPHTHSLPFTISRRQRSAKLLEQPTAWPPLLPHRNPKPPIFVFSFLLLGRFPAIKSFLGALQRKSGRPIHLLNQSEQCRAGRQERPPAPPCLVQAGTGKGTRNRPEGPRVTLEQGDGRASHPVGRRHGHPIAYPREVGMPPAKRGPPRQAAIPQAGTAHPQRGSNFRLAKFFSLAVT